MYVCVVNVQNMHMFITDSMYPDNMPRWPDPRPNGDQRWPNKACYLGRWYVAANK